MKDPSLFCWARLRRRKNSIIAAKAITNADTPMTPAAITPGLVTLFDFGFPIAESVEVAAPVSDVELVLELSVGVVCSPALSVDKLDEEGELESVAELELELEVEVIVVGVKDMPVNTICRYKFVACPEKDVSTVVAWSEEPHPH